MVQRKALSRKPNLAVHRSMSLDAETRIDVIGITARKTMEIMNNKSLTDTERGVHVTAAKILVNGQPIVYDDLLDSFTGDELTKILEFANDIKEGEEKNV